MTHMTATPDERPARRVAIRELQQHAARLIRELAESQEMAEITNRGTVIARLIPVSPAERAFMEMVEQGEIIPAVNAGGLADWRPLPARGDDRALSDEILAMRDQERE